MNSIIFRCCEKPIFYKEDRILILYVEVLNRCFLTKKNIKISLSPSENGCLRESFEQNLFAKNNNGSFIAGFFPVNKKTNNFMSPFTLKWRQSLRGCIIIELKENCWCNSVRLLSPKGKILSEFSIKEEDIKIESSIIEQKL